MRRFKIIATLPNGDEVKASVEATDEASAIARLKEAKQFKEFVGQTMPEIVITDLGESLPVDVDTCEISQEGSACVLIHKQSGVALKFEAGRFNATVKVWKSSVEDAEEIARIMREAGEWMVNFQRGLAFDLRAITRAYMQERGVTGKALSLEIGCMPQVLSAYLNGDRNLPYGAVERLLAILRAADVL